MLNINVLYIYPKIKEINKEINLFRIIDNNIKETIVVYCVKGKDNYEVSMINTMSGETNKIYNAKELFELDILMSKMKKLESELILLNNLEKIEKHILNSIPN